LYWEGLEGYIRRLLHLVSLSVFSISIEHTCQLRLHYTSHRIQSLRLHYYTHTFELYPNNLYEYLQQCAVPSFSLFSPLWPPTPPSCPARTPRVHLLPKGKSLCLDRLRWPTSGTRVNNAVLWVRALTNSGEGAGSGMAPGEGAPAPGEPGSGEEGAYTGEYVFALCSRHFLPAHSTLYIAACLASHSITVLTRQRSWCGKFRRPGLRYRYRRPHRDPQRGRSGP
jgi:hypothetical protein